MELSSWFPSWSNTVIQHFKPLMMFNLQVSIILPTKYMAKWESSWTWDRYDWMHSISCQCDFNLFLFPLHFHIHTWKLDCVYRISSFLFFVAFKALGKLMMEVGLMLAHHCDRYGMCCRTIRSITVTRCDFRWKHQLRQKGKLTHLAWAKHDLYAWFFSQNSLSFFFHRDMFIN